jgi:hypothetical protein
MTRRATGNAIDQGARALWLFLRNDSGAWSVPGLTYHWRPTFDDAEVAAHLEALHRGGFVQRCTPHVHGLGHPIYAITSNCRALPGLSLVPRPQGVFS